MTTTTDKRELPVTPRKTNDEFAAFARRIIRAYSRRVANGDVEALVGLVRLSDDLTAAIDSAAVALHDFGYSWTEIADRLGVSRQAARQRWAREEVSR